MYIIKQIYVDEHYFRIYYLQKNGLFSNNKYTSKKFLTKKIAEKYAKKYNLFYTNIEDYRVELELKNNSPYYILNDIIRIIKECKKCNTGKYGFVADEFADLIIDEIRNEYDELFINNI